MLKVYGSPHCPDCVAFEEGLKKANVPFEFVDITGSMRNLKEFLAIRDKEELFAGVKARGGVGVPLAVTDDGKMTLDYEEILASYNQQVQPKTSCSLDGKGC